MTKTSTAPTMTAEQRAHKLAEVEAERALSEGEGYPQLEALVRTRCAAATDQLYQTDATGLFDLFLTNLPAERRHHYVCNHCRQFFDRYGGLVEITNTGHHRSVLWSPADGAVSNFFVSALAALWTAVERAKVTGPFVSSEETWGCPSNVTGPGSPTEGVRWTHLSGPNPSVYRDKLRTADQRMAEWAQDRAVLCRALDEFRADAVAEAVRVLEADAVNRTEKVLGLAQWFQRLKQVWDAVKGPARSNRVWQAIATAPPGWAHVRNTVLGPLLDDVQAGHDFETVRRRFNAKMHPLQYQRPTAVTEGNLQVAERLIEKLGAARSLERRFARLDEVLPHALWQPTEVATPTQAGGVFGSLRPTRGEAKGGPPVKPLALPAQRMTWARFAAEVLPHAAKLEVLVPARGPFHGLVTAAHPDAPPIVQWDGLETAGNGVEAGGDGPDRLSGVKIPLPRNPATWYYHQPVGYARHWDLTAGAWEPVAAVTPFPCHWQRPDLFAHQPTGVMLAVEKMRDGREGPEKVGGGLFPELIRTEYREAKAAVEAYSKAAAVAGAADGTANGLSWRKGGPWADCRLRVTTAAGVATEYEIDRWE